MRKNKDVARAGETLLAIAAQQRPVVQPEKGEATRVLLEARGLIDRVGPFVRATLTKKDAEKTLKDAAGDLVEKAAPLFEAACEDGNALLASADLAGGTWHDEDSHEDLEVFDGEVQFQCLLEGKDLEIGSKAEKALGAAGRKLMPEAVKLELTVDLVDRQEAAELLKDLGEERIKRWFKVTAVRRAPDGDVVRELFTRGQAGRKTLAGLVAAGAVKVKQFVKLIARN